MAERWLVAHDSSPCAQAALERAAADAPGHGATLVLLHVVNELPPVAGYDWFGPGGSMMGWSELNQELVDGARSDLDETARRLRAEHDGLEVEILVRVGAPAQEILDAARSLAVDRVVIGTHGRRGLESFLFGSVAERVLRLSEVPVLVVKARSG